MNASEADLVKRLRSESDGLKDCFTRFSFQAIGLGAIVFSLLAKTAAKGGMLVVACGLVVVMLLAVAKIGLYKYHQANIVSGYELHLERTQNLADTERGWCSWMRDIGWEEARRAWRVVQPTVFRHLYYYNFFVPNYKRPMLRRAPLGSRWFEAGSLVASAGLNAAYYPGGYLRLMLVMLHGLALIASIPIWIAAYGGWTLRPQHLGLAGAAGFLTVFSLVRALEDLPRLKLVEGGLLSLHACAEMWAAVVLAHYRALHALEGGEGRGFEEYTRNLALQADSLRRSVFRIDGWLGY